MNPRAVQFPRSAPKALTVRSWDIAPGAYDCKNKLLWRPCFVFGFRDVFDCFWAWFMWIGMVLVQIYGWAPVSQNILYGPVSLVWPSVRPSDLEPVILRKRHGPPLLTKFNNTDILYTQSNVLTGIFTKWTILIYVNITLFYHQSGLKTWYNQPTSYLIFYNLGLYHKW